MTSLHWQTGLQNRFNCLLNGIKKTRWSCPWNSDQNCTQNSARGGGGQGGREGRVGGQGGRGGEVKGVGVVGSRG